MNTISFQKAGAVLQYCQATIRMSNNRQLQLQIHDLQLQHEMISPCTECTVWRLGMFSCADRCQP